MAETVIDIKKLRKIIREEIEAPDAKDGLNHEEIVAIATSASKLLGSLEAFEEKAPQAAKDALTNRCGDLRGTLEDLVTNPAAYTSKQTAQNVAVPSAGPQPMETGPKVNIAPQGRPVLDHKQFVESINRRLRANKKK